MEKAKAIQQFIEKGATGTLSAFFCGNDEKNLYIQIEDSVNEKVCAVILCPKNNTRESMVCECGTLCRTEGTRLYIPLQNLEKANVAFGEYFICIGTVKEEEFHFYFLIRQQMLVDDSCKCEFFDRRSLYGKAIPLPHSEKVAVPYYAEDHRVGIDIEDISGTYQHQIKNEIVMIADAEEPNTCICYAKCKRVEGNYIGILNSQLNRAEHITPAYIPYERYDEKDEDVYLTFRLSKDDLQNEYWVAWNCHGKIYYAPLALKEKKKYAKILKLDFSKKKELRLTVQIDKNKYGEYKSAQLLPIAEIWQHKSGISVAPTEVVEQNGFLWITYSLDTSELIPDIGEYVFEISTEKSQIANTLYLSAEIEGNYQGAQLFQQKFYDKGNTKTKLYFALQDKKVILARAYDTDAFVSQNLQKFAKKDSLEPELTLDEFLTQDVSPKGRIFAGFKQKQKGNLHVEIFQDMENILEAKLVMYHTQGLGILATQDLRVTDGKLYDFRIHTPDIAKSGKILKPVNSIWFRMAIAIRRPEGIYFLILKQFDVDASIHTGNIYDIRHLYRDPIGDIDLCEIRMSALPYYASNQELSMKYVRPEQIYRSQFTNELLDVKIKKNILSVKMKCQDCHGVYKGILLEYRKEKEDDAQTYLIPYETLVEKDGSWIMTAKVDLKKYYLRMLYWDIRCAFEKDGEIFTVSCHSNNEKFLKKYKKVLVDRCYPNENSILFPYATANNSVALMHRETCPQDNWKFRLKERVALTLYKAFKNHWDNKNIYLIFEKYCIMAQDNGYYFFKYCMDANVEKDFSGHIYYVLDKHSSDWEKIKPYESHVVKYLSLRHMIYLLACHLMISTDTKGHAYVWRSMGSEIKALSYKKNLVFLQHGVTAFKRGHFEKGTNVGCEYFITTSEFEHNIIRNYLGYVDNEIPITGFARWDVLQDKSKGHREILMMPTWRTWLDDAENEVFAQSDYCKNYMALLNNPMLDQILKEYDVTLNFYLHPKFRKFITEFSVVSDHIRLIPFGEEPLNELMMQCNLLITDFSSVAWDVYYMGKPVLFYHFDMEDANKTLGFYMDMKNDIFGERAEAPDELMALITEYIKNGFQMKMQYLENRDKYFAYIDNDNSERIWKAIRKINW